MAIARRRGLLCDELLVALADNSWEILDVSGSDVTDFSLMAAASTCPRLQVVDIRLERALFLIRQQKFNWTNADVDVSMLISMF